MSTATVDRNNPVLAMFASADVHVANEKQDWLASCIAGLAAHANISDMLAETTAAADDGFWPEPDSWRAALRPYVVKDGILHIPVRGMLLHEFPWQAGNWATGYEYIRRAFERGARDFKAGNIKGIALVVHSGGGLVSGCWDAVDRMEAVKAEYGVPVRTFFHEFGYSAAYGIGCVGDVIYISRTGGCGSIGTLRTHVDWSKFNERLGLTYTFVQAGEFKTDGHPDKPLSDSAQQRWQEQVNELNEIFVAAVSRNRGLDPQAIRDLNAGTFSATQALSNGLADEIGTLEDALVAYAADLSSVSGDEQMSTQDTAATNQAAIDAARAEGRTEGHAAGLAEGQTAAVKRINDILASDEAKERPKAALSAALKTGMSVDEAKAFLGDLVKESTQAAVQGEPQTPFETAMDQGNPNVGASTGKPEGDEAKDDGSDVLALARNAGLTSFAQQKPAA